MSGPVAKPLARVPALGYSAIYGALMNILQIGSYLYPDLVGGAEISASSYHEHLTNRGHKVCSLRWKQADGLRSTQMCRSGDLNWEALSPRAMSPIERGALPQKLNFYAQEFLTKVDRDSLHSLISAESIEVVLVHSFRGIGYDLITALSEMNKPTVFVLHDLALVCMNKSMSRKNVDCKSKCFQCVLTTTVVSSALKKMDRLMIIGPSKMILDKVEHELKINNARYEYLPNPNIYNLNARVRGGPKNPFRIGYFGRLEHDKGVAELQKFAKAVSQRYPAELHIAGDGSLKELVTSWDGKDGIKFHGFVPSEKMRDLYADIDCLLLPSLWKENFPGVAVQALMSGVPVVGFDAGGIGEIVESGRSGLLVEKGDFAALAQSVIRLIECPDLLSEMSQAAIECSKIYDPDHLGDRLAKLINENCFN
jgi:glycosyltransferase involved in cell wall biosynthesis